MHIAHKKKLGLMALSLGEYSEVMCLILLQSKYFLRVLHSPIKIVGLQIFCSTFKEDIYIYMKNYMTGTAQ
jgi:hypothetical protein